MQEPDFEKDQDYQFALKTSSDIHKDMILEDVSGKKVQMIRRFSDTDNLAPYTKNRKYSLSFQAKPSDNRSTGFFERHAKLVAKTIRAKFDDSKDNNPNFLLFWNYYVDLTKKLVLSSTGVEIEPTGESKRYESIVKHLQQTSSFRRFKSLKIRGLIVKYGDDLRQEVLAMNLIRVFQDVFDRHSLSLPIRTYDITLTGCHSGFIGTQW